MIWIRSPTVRMFDRECKSVILKKYLSSFPQNVMVPRFIVLMTLPLKMFLTDSCNTNCRRFYHCPFTISAITRTSFRFLFWFILYQPIGGTRLELFSRVLFLPIISTTICITNEIIKYTKTFKLKLKFGLKTIKFF